VAARVVIALCTRLDEGRTTDKDDPAGHQHH
jgi:hypothetical protein